MNRVRQPKHIPLILYHKFLDIANFRGSWEREKELLEIFSGIFFVEIFSRGGRVPKNFLPRNRSGEFHPKIFS